MNTVNDAINAEYEERLAIAQLFVWGRSRRRLFGIYGLAVCGLAATAMLAMAILENTGGRGVQLPYLPFFGGVFGSVAISGIIFLVVMKVSSGLVIGQNDGAAWFLLCLTPVSNAILMNALVGMAVEFDMKEVITPLLQTVYPIVSVGLAAILPVNILVGFNGGAVQSMFRWVVNVAIITVSLVIFVDKDLWWAGLAGGIFLAGVIKSIFDNATDNPQIPAPALAACLVAGVGFIVLFIIYLIIRFVLRIFATSAEAAAAMQQ